MTNDIPQSMAGNYVLRYEVKERSGPYANIQSLYDGIWPVLWGGLFMQMVDLRVSYCW